MDERKSAFHLEQQGARSAPMWIGAVKVSELEPVSSSGRLVATAPPTCQAISDRASEHLTAIDELVRALQASTVEYRHRPLDWSDVASLRQVRENLGGTVKRFSSAEIAASLQRAARQVARELRRFP